jgi:hypothetical protein
MSMCEISLPLAEDCGDGWQWLEVDGGSFIRSQVGDLRFSPLVEAKVYRLDSGAVAVNDEVASVLRTKFGGRISIRGMQNLGFSQLLANTQVHAQTEFDEDDEAEVISLPLRIDEPPADCLVVSLVENPRYILVSQELAEVLQQLEPKIECAVVAIKFGTE